MKTLFYFVPLILLLTGTMQAQNVTIKGKKFQINGRDTFLVVCNYGVNIFKVSNSSYYLTAEHETGANNGFECNDPSSCKTNILNNFKEIKSMGFNTIRLVGIGPQVDTTLARDTLHNVIPGTSDMTFHVKAFTSDTTNDLFRLTPPFATEPNMQTIFNFIDIALTLADSAGLKVIFLCGDQINSLPYFDLYYPSLLAAISSHISNASPQIKRALLAYDLYNEPCYKGAIIFPPITTGHSKFDACHRVSAWYDTLKLHDPDHLVTLGGCGMSDVSEWDPAILKLDFYSPHVYPVQASFEPSDSAYKYMVDRVKGFFYWVNNNCPVPYIIGETGFTAIDMYNYDYPYTDGSLAEQKTYVEQTLTSVQENGGSGYSWWIYQDGFGWHWKDNLGVVHYDTSGQRFMGLLRHGDCNPVNCSFEKPVVDAFQAFSPNTPVTQQTQPPDGYYDPFYHAFRVHQQYPPPTVIHGTVIDEFGKPIKGAVIDCHPNKGHPYSTYTNDAGEFTLYPLKVYPYEQDENLNKISAMVISAAGAERTMRIDDETNAIWHWGDSVPDVVNNEVFILKINHFNYNGTISDETITNSKNLQAWNSLTVQNVNISSGATIDIRARDEVHLTDGFEAHSGSNVHIYNTEIFPECVDYSSFARIAHMPKTAPYINIAETQSKEIEVDFIKKHNGFKVALYPNPSNGLLNIEVQNNIDASTLISIYSLQGGKLVDLVAENQKLTFDISHLSKGMYYVRIQNNNDSVIKKLVIQ